jgi:Ala-tRNA(Pro) deacylase
MEANNNPNTPSIFDQLCSLLNAAGAKFRILEHPHEGRSDAIAAIRGTAPEQGAKAMLCIFKDANETAVLAVIPGTLKLDFKKVGAVMGRKKATLAPPELAAQWTHCVMGAVPPFVFGDKIKLIVDPALIEKNQEIAFNAGRLDRSIVLNAEDYVRIARPIMAGITVSAEVSQ